MQEFEEKVYRFLMRFLLVVLLLIPIGYGLKSLLFNEPYGNPTLAMLVVLLLIFMVRQGKSFMDFKKRYGEISQHHHF